MCVHVCMLVRASARNIHCGVAVCAEVSIHVKNEVIPYGGQFSLGANFR